MKKQRFPQVNEACTLAIQQYIMHALKHSDPFVSQLPETIIYEGDSTHGLQMGGAEIGMQVDTPADNIMSRISSPHEITGKGMIETDDIREVRLEAFWETLFDVARGLDQGRGNFVFSKLVSISDEEGRSVDGKGEPFTFEHWLQVLETMTIEFDGRGDPIWPTTVIPPAMQPRVNKEFQKAVKNPEKMQALKRLLNKKREVFNAKEANRKLVD
jgi:hypothetical protein